MFELHDKVRIINGGPAIYVVTGADNRNIYRLQQLGINFGPVILKQAGELELVAKDRKDGDLCFVPISCDQLH